jgi:hypothetical protein
MMIDDMEYDNMIGETIQERVSMIANEIVVELNDEELMVQFN